MNKAIVNLLEDERGQFALWMERRWWFVDGGVSLWPWPKRWAVPEEPGTQRLWLNDRGFPDYRPIHPKGSEETLRRVAGNWGQVYRISDVGTTLHGTREQYRLGGLTVEPFVREYDGERALIQAKFANMFRKMAKAICNEPRLVQVTGKGIDAFLPLQQPVLLLDESDKKCSLRAAVMCVRQGDAKLERIN